MVRKECRACLSSNKRFKYTIAEYKIFQCQYCNSLYVENFPDEEKLKELYKSDEYYSLPKDSVQRILKENLRRIKIINKLHTAGKVLDIGCAKGLFLDAIKNSNYKTYGIELSEKNVEICKRKGHDVFHGDLNDFFLEYKGTINFNIITCLDVIEHIEYPKDFIWKIRELLNDDGILIISTPNFSGIVSKLLGNKDPFLIPPEHINFFSQKGLKELMRQTSLHIVLTKTFGYLTNDGLNRAIFKYIPPVFHPFNFLIKPLLNYSIKALNLFNNGLELELFLKKF